MDYLAHFERDPRKMGGETVIRGTRVPVRVVLASLAHGDPIEAFLADYPTVTEADVRAVIAYASSEALSWLPVPGIEPMPLP